MLKLFNARSVARCLGPAALVLILGAATSRGASAQTLQIPSGLRSVVYHWAPFLVREALSGVVCELTSLEVNQAVRIDFDNDPFEVNNEYRSTCGNTLYDDLTATVYYSAVETGTGSDNGYYYLGYYWYEPKDNGFWAGWDIGEDGHEHDLEGIVMLIQKSPTAPYGNLLNVLTQSHGGLLPYGANIPGSGSGVPAHNFGSVAWWTDNREFGHNRPVAISAAGTHATYEPEICDANTVQPAGIVSQAQTGGPYEICVRQGNDVIVYQPLLEAALTPSLGLPGPDQLSTGQQNGLWTYQLLELSQSSMWLQRENQDYFNGDHLALPGGLYGNRFFASNLNYGQANPPWAWNGAQSCHTIPYTYDSDCYVYNSFADDGTRNVDEDFYLPVTPYGRILTDPATDFASRFTGLPNLAAAPPRYNPYVASPPNYDGSISLSADINGPNMVTAGISYTWSAMISGGTAPYTIQWSGPLGGNDTSVSGSLYSSDTIYLDVWDATNHHAAVSIYVTVCDSTQLIC